MKFLNRITLFAKDITIQSATAGFVAALVGYASSAIIVFEAAKAIGLSEAEASSWLMVICIGMGLLSFILSLYYQIPAMFAWSTAGAALLIVGLKGESVNDAMGVFLFSAFLIFLSGVTGWFEKILHKIPVSIAGAMLSGILLKFTLEAFLAIKTNSFLCLPLFFIYIFFRKIYPRYTIVAVLVVGILLSKFFNLIHLESVSFAINSPEFHMPTFNLRLLLSVGLPLFLVTMTSQNITGVAVLKSFGYKAPISKLITASGLVNLIIAPFGGFALNLSAITAAIGMGNDVHPDPAKRYPSAAFSGLLYILIGFFSGSVGSLFQSFPKEFVMSLAGLALVGTVSQGLITALQEENEREAAMLTFFITASGVNLFGIGPAFWGILGGTIAFIVIRKKA